MMRAVWFALGLVAAGVFVGVALAGESAPLAAAFFFVVALVVILPCVAVLRVIRGGGTFRQRLKRPEGLALALSLLALGIAVIVPWFMGLVDGADGLVRMAGAVAVAVAIFAAGRRLKPGWAVLTSIALVGSCLSAALLSNGLAEWVGWQDLHWRETTDDPLDGSSVDIGWGILGAVVFAPVAGTALGLASQVNKREPVSAQGAMAGSAGVPGSISST